MTSLTGRLSEVIEAVLTSLIISVILLTPHFLTTVAEVLTTTEPEGSHSKDAFLYPQMSQ
jgi:hypothetical protein